uniref:HTH_48 domain-containing protein n=1 Tax=Strongyloides papillosus TaxID=174720 RepID=A0A0N5C689_STREA
MSENFREIYSVYGEDAMGWSTAKYWYRKFRNDNFDLQDSPRTDRLSIFDEDRSRKDNRQIYEELAEKMNSVIRAISRHLTSMGSEQKFRV